MNSYTSSVHALFSILLVFLLFSSKVTAEQANVGVEGLDLVLTPTPGGVLRVNGSLRVDRDISSGSLSSDTQTLLAAINQLTSLVNTQFALIQQLNESLVAIKQEIGTNQSSFVCPRRQYFSYNATAQIYRVPAGVQWIEATIVGAGASLTNGGSTTFVGNGLASTAFGGLAQGVPGGTSGACNRSVFGGGGVGSMGVNFGIPSYFPGANGGLCVVQQNVSLGQSYTITTGKGGTPGDGATGTSLYRVTYYYVGVDGYVYIDHYCA